MHLILYFLTSKLMICTNEYIVVHQYYWLSWFPLSQLKDVIDMIDGNDHVSFDAIIVINFVTSTVGFIILLETMATNEVEQLYYTIASYMLYLYT